MAKNMMNSALRVKTLFNVSNEQFFNRAARFYHPDLGKFPGVPLQIHDSEFDFFPERGRPLNFFVPSLSELDYDELKEEAMIRFYKAVDNGQKILQRTSEINLILISNQALQTAKDVPNRIWKNNYFVSNEGLIALEKMFPVEKMIVGFKEKLSSITDKMSSGREVPPQVVKVWESVKEKLPTWQNAIALKLQEFQNRINKGTAKKEEVESRNAN